MLKNAWYKRYGKFRQNKNIPYRDVIIPHPKKNIISFAIPHPICTPFNNHYYPIRTIPQGQATPDVAPDLTIASLHA